MDQSNRPSTNIYADDNMMVDIKYRLIQALVAAIKDSLS
jgi:hypothetical protein